MIRCGHCGGGHATVAEVRDCDGQEASLLDHLEPEPEAVPTSVEPDGPGGRADRAGVRRRRSVPRPLPPPEPPGVAPVGLEPHWERLAGPAALGRGVLVSPGQDVPPPWQHAPRVIIEAGSVGAEVVDELQRRWSRREPVVVELADELPDPEPVLHVEPWELSPDLELGHERLRHLLTANLVDARNPLHPVFGPVSAAVSAGARPGGPADVIDATGTTLWCDGGPLTWFEPLLDGHAVVPAAHLDAGVLSALTVASTTADLAPDQLEAVTHHGGGARIIAPAGSGKTRVLTERARHLLRDRGIHPSLVCLVAFNVRARAEMQERTTDLAGLEIRTLNSLALAIVNGSPPFVRPSRRRATVEVVDERQVRRVLAELVNTRRQAMADPYAVWIEALTACRLGLRTPQEVEQDFGGDVAGFAEVLPRFRDRLAQLNQVDFDEQILGAIEVLLTDPAARAVARRVCRLLLVDEFQDLTPAHVLLVRLLAGPQAEVFGVGDDDQTIYGYSGASPAWLIEFDRLFPGAVHHDLHVNYRCPPEVVTAASHLLSHNRRRVAKQIEAAAGRSPGEGLVVRSGADPVDELVDHVGSLVAAGVEPHHIAVLTRVNATLLAPLVALTEAGVRTDRPIDASFLSRTGVAAALAWLGLATGAEHRLSADLLENAARRPPRGLSRRTVDWVAEKSSPREILDLARRLRDERDRNKVESFVADLTTLRRLAERGGTTEQLLRAIRDDLGLGGALDRRLDASRRSVDRSAHGDDLAALLAIARFEPAPDRFPDWLARRLGPPRKRGGAPEQGGGVALATVHRVKGREWPHVVVYEATAGLFPHRLADDREEERRVFHVAITRGAQQVVVLPGTPPSPFLAQLEREAPAHLPPEPASERSSVRSSGRSGPRVKLEAPPADTLLEARLRERLKSWRSQRSRADGVPAYVVFNDATLRELARLRPSSPPELLAVPGIGPAKAERYGAEVLELLAAAD